MKSENKLSKFAILVLLVTMVALILLSGTYAKYTTTVTGTDTATIAKWSVELGYTDLETQTETTTFDLFKSTGVYDLAGVTDPEDLSAATATVDEDVAKGETVKVAPGTWGKVTFNVENASDVTASYAVTITSLTTTLPLEFSTDGKTWVEASDIDTTNPYSLGADTLAIGSTTPTTATVDLYWKWDFESGVDTDETNLGIAGTATCSITAGVTFEQVN